MPRNNRYTHTFDDIPDIAEPLNVYDNYASFPRPNPSQKYREPTMYWHEDLGQEVVSILFELPGFKPGDVHLGVDSRQLCIWAESRIFDHYYQIGSFIVRDPPRPVWTLKQLPTHIRQRSWRVGMKAGLLAVEFLKNTPLGGS
ncbi:hypothetical protein AN958_11862 [Leucoagaricus sp. SymC.cos]|nr:hypothetical protein AN958_11862 [Leucoagaricus sp. SymC.cos]